MKRSSLNLIRTRFTLNMQRVNNLIAIHNEGLKGRTI
jgi:hypothetical protein